ncbi:MAG: redoxin domain-containing protein [Bacteroidetes bacterium]|nr:redoxin domain-containing protein [Bacteroidota bacterium]
MIRTVFLAIFSLALIKVKAGDTLRLNITPQIGYGNLSKSFGIISMNPMPESNPWKSTESKVKGIPAEWKDPVVHQIWFDAHQFAYQNYKLGKITRERFLSLTESWNIDTTKNLSTRPINCFVNIVLGKVHNDSIVYRIDTNHNLDFSDEKTTSIYYCEKPFDPGRLTDSVVRSNSVFVYGDFQIGGKIVSREIPIFILRHKDGEILQNFPVHYRSFLKNNTLFIAGPSSGVTFYSGTILYNETDIKNKINKGEYILLDGKYYKYLKADFRSLTLSLEEMPGDTVPFSSQIGMRAIPFKARKFGSDSAVISLSDFKGKFVYLDFWGTWCAPCVEEIANIRRAHSNLDSSKIVFIGIAVDSPDPLKSAIEKYAIKWIQILSDEENDFRKLYNINAYPTTILIDPSGVIIARAIRGEDLKEQLMVYIDSW